MALIYCPECGKQVSDSASTCPNCGYPISSLNMGGNQTQADYFKPESGKYNVFLTAALSEGVSATARVLADVLGYTYADALALANNLPTIVLYNVTLDQAKAAANALADYGMDVAVYDENGYVDFSDYEYDSDSYTTTESGTSVASELLRTIRTISVANLISRAFMRSYSYPYPYETWIPFTRRPRFYYDPYYRRWNYYRRPTLVESLLGLNGGYMRYQYNPLRYSSMPQYRSNYRTPGAPPRSGPRPNGNPRPASRPSSGGLFGNGGLFGGLFSGGSSSSGGASTVGGTSKPGMGHSTRTYRTSGSSGSTKSSFGGWTGSSGSSSSSRSGSSSRSSSSRSSGSSGFGSLFGSSKSSSGFSSHSSSTPRSFGGSSGRSSSFGSSRSSGGSFGSRSSGSFGGSRSSGGFGGKVGGGSKGGFGHGKR